MISYKSGEDQSFGAVAQYLEETTIRRTDNIDWEDIADGFYTLFRHYEEISLENGSTVFRELKDNYKPSKDDAEEVLFSYAVEGEDLETAIESNIYS